MPRLSLVFGALLLACGAPPPAARVVAPAPTPHDPPMTPSALVMLHVRGLRDGERTRPAVEVANALLPPSAAPERLDDLEWLAADGPSPLASREKNVVFVQSKGAPLRTIHGDASGLANVPMPAPPAAHELVRIRVHEPKTILRIPHFEPSDAVRDLAIVAEARADGGADLHLRETCATTNDATAAALALDDAIEHWNESGIGVVTGGLFADARATVDGTDARLDIRASADQVGTIAELARAIVRGP